MTDFDDKMRWFREAKFGLFIHWGLYALPAGQWAGEDVPGIGEWIMKRARIPVQDYAQLAPQFNPVQFDASQWVQLAQDAGMKYIVITAKHHDGFSMYDSTASDYNIVQATPFQRDPLKELALACEQAGIKLCFYYSHVQDWHHPDAEGNDWDFPDSSQKNFARYLEEKAKPQIRELLTQYGPIGLIWFDTPMYIEPHQSRELADLVREIQPNCLVSGRVGHQMGDYRQMGDNQYPTLPLPFDWETPATLNDTWGYKRYDVNWKSPEMLMRILVDANSKGGNYLLNVGPTAEGLIPAASVELLRTLGDWMKINGESIYGTLTTPSFIYRFNWGAITRKPGKLFLHVLHWPTNGTLQLYGLKNPVQHVYLLDGGENLPSSTVYYESRNEHILNIQIPTQAPNSLNTVIVLEFAGELQLDNFE